ncbi:sulfite exporter TauE/SafE family protein [Allosalinactinospora lopnorensis]|uniref:sulfite exporter TauE/SafE family protein n=1 Tax=Allosalinactinospora lopnorensis TaxID=1352348 RepID=UPI000623C324|nr:sulfite exporter TauE/SafE family protein [Allosalinactinospora lopnorensis]
MSLWDALAILLAGIGAGGINAIVGSGTLLTFPVLLALGYPPVLASISNSIGLAPGALTGAIGYRRELKGQRSRLIRFGSMAFAGALTGGALLLNLPEGVFESVVPVLIAMSCVLIMLQPRITAWARKRRPARLNGGVLLPFGIYGAGVYGGYFAAAQGIVLISMMGAAMDEELHRINALKNVLAFVVNATAAAFYIIFASPIWPVVGLIAAGSVLGGYFGAWFGRKLTPFVLRIVIVAVGLTAAAQLLLGRI